MAEGVCAHLAGVLTDKGALSVVNALGDADYQVGCGLQGGAHLLDEGILVKGHLRQVDEHRVVPLKLPGQHAGGCEPSGVAAHDLHDGDRLLVVVHGGVDGDLPHGGGHVLGGASISRCVVCLHQVVVNGLGNADEADGTVHKSGVPGQLAHRVHGVVSSYIKEVADIQLLKASEQLRVHWVVQVLRQLVAAGAQVSARRGAHKLQLVGCVQGSQIHVVALEKSLYSVDHSVYRVDVVCHFDTLRHNTVETSVDDCRGTSGLSHNDIFFHVLSSKLLFSGQGPARQGQGARRPSTHNYTGKPSFLQLCDEDFAKFKLEKPEEYYIL